MGAKLLTGIDCFRTHLLHNILTPNALNVHPLSLALICQGYGEAGANLLQG